MLGTGIRCRDVPSPLRWQKFNESWQNVEEKERFCPAEVRLAVRDSVRGYRCQGSKAEERGKQCAARWLAARFHAVLSSQTWQTVPLKGTTWDNCWIIAMQLCLTPFFRSILPKYAPPGGLRPGPHRDREVGFSGPRHWLVGKNQSKEVGPNGLGSAPRPSKLHFDAWKVASLF